MRDDVTMKRHLSLAGRINKMIPGVVYIIVWWKTMLQWDSIIKQYNMKHIINEFVIRIARVSYVILIGLV